MPDYKELYHKLWNAMTDAILILQEAQKDTEEAYINSEHTVSDLLNAESALKDE